jgi:uncharacterized protein YndB with AHSA1/START domain
MENSTQHPITIETIVNAPIEKVWNCWTAPGHIVKWNFASDDWHCPAAENDLRVNGEFKSTMAAKDGSFSFNFEGVYTDVQIHKLIAYTIVDGRKVKISFAEKDSQTKVIETFEPENENPEEMQKDGWQAILNNFKKLVEEEK